MINEVFLLEEEVCRLENIFNESLNQITCNFSILAQSIETLKSKIEIMKSSSAYQKSMDEAAEMSGGIYGRRPE